MEFILELVLEIVLDGTVEVIKSQSKKVPVFLRFIVSFILVLLSGGIFIGLLWVGIVNNDLIVIGISLCFLIVAMTFLFKAYQGVKRKKSDV